MLDLIKKYSFVPPYEEDKSFYVDWGETEDFSLDGLSQGECGAGVMDMMKADLDSAYQSLIKAKEKDFDLEEIKYTLLFSARALLVVKGIDPKSEVEAVNSFIEKFIIPGICDPRFKNLAEVYETISLGKMGKKAAYDFTQDFYEEVKNIYSLMDSGFNFPVRFSSVSVQKAEKSSAKESLIYDLRGTPSPINYVKAKMKLEDLETDDILEIYLDEGEPIRNVTASLKKDGQEIIEIKQIENYYNVIIRKKV
jgi:sulfite reductase (ferredoxin)